jgi:hypothetical protein
LPTTRGRKIEVADPLDYLLMPTAVNVPRRYEVLVELPETVMPLAVKLPAAILATTRYVYGPPGGWTSTTEKPQFAMPLWPRTFATNTRRYPIWVPTIAGLVGVAGVSTYKKMSTNANRFGAAAVICTPPSVERIVPAVELETGTTSNKSGTGVAVVVVRAMELRDTANMTP